MQRHEQPLPFLVPQLNWPQKRKRSPKATLACESCRASKSKCDQGQPCSVCSQSSLQCSYRQKRPGRPVGTANRTHQVQKDAQRERDQLLRPLNPTNTPRRQPVLPAPQSSTVNNSEIVPANPNLPVATSAVHVNTHLGQGNETVISRPPIQDRQEQNGISSRPDSFIYKGLGQDRIEKVGDHNSSIGFYGPTATLAFLIELRSRAQSFQSSSSKGATTGETLLQSSNIEQEASESEQLLTSHSASMTIQDSSELHYSDTEAFVASPASSITSSLISPNVNVEKECIQLFFSNLYLIYYFLDKEAFLALCEAEVWSSESSMPRQKRRPKSKFLALYSAVVAVGAITAGDDTVVAQNCEKVQGSVDNCPMRRSAHSSKQKPVHSPLELAQIYFMKAKSLLGDLFEACSLESTQTLFLMSIFCQYTLKPHECYMYSGMAARTASAIGIANEPDLSKTSVQSIRTWWCMYYHEMEICCYLGRESVLREPTYYSVFMAKFPDPLPSEYAIDSDTNVFFARAMTELAYILKQTSEDIYHSPSSLSQENRPQVALKLDADLCRWKSQLSSVFDLDNSSLTEPESVTKRKIVLKLRLFSTRILIHRPFLVAAAHEGSSSMFIANIQLCVKAATETIHLLYDTFINRPFFRTWWYNTTYAFNSITVILYALVAQLQKASSEELLKVVEKSLKIFQAMNRFAVARRCAELTQEIFDIAKSTVLAQQQRYASAMRLIMSDKADSLGNAIENLGGSNNSWDTMNQFGLNALPDSFFASSANLSTLENFGTDFLSSDIDLSAFDNVDLLPQYGGT